MDPITFAQTLLRRWWILVACAAVGLGVAYWMATRTPPRYQSTVSLQLNPAGRSPFLPYSSAGVDPSISPVMATAASYREVLRSRAFGELFVQQLQLPIPPDSIASAIDTQLVPNTNILHLNVTWDNPGDAQQLAERIAETFIVENQRRQQTQPGTQAQLAGMEQSASNIEDRITPLQQQREKLNQDVANGDLSHLSELTSLEDRLGALETSHANLLVEISRIRSSFDTAVIVDPATAAFAVGTTPVSQALVFGLIGGLGAALGIILLLEYLADAVRSRRDVIEATGVAPLGRLRHARTRLWRRAPHHKGVVMLDNDAPHTAEAFRSLRASLSLATAARPVKSLAVTSAGPREGKTFVACNLAIALAQSGQRVLLVDADLRRPSLHTWLHVPPQPGLTEALSHATNGHTNGSTDVSGVVATDVHNLWVLPAGATAGNPSELLDSAALPRTLNHLSRLWDLVVLDTAPVGPVADTLLVSRYASASVVVARSGRTRRSGLRGALDALSSSTRPVLGVVLNDERPGPLARFSRYDYFHHGYWTDPALTPPSSDPQALPRGVDG